MDTLDTQKEVRFAVVMYGGISLAIYINGVAQELYQIVRATTDPKEVRASNLEYSKDVYRRIGEKLGLKFVIDILSGTSAGGINAIYLAKALANQQDMKSVEQVWLEEGDIEKLVNDKNSTGGIDPGLKTFLNRRPQQSLLNNHRMYYKLLKALDDMDKVAANPISPYAKEIDLYITATDLNGLPLPLPVSNNFVYEKKYRSVFQFRYPSTDDNAGFDFSKKSNPILAFAARCTSSLPFAFEPMTLGEIKNVLENSSDLNEYDYRVWKEFFGQYASSGKITHAKKMADEGEYLSFGDGGYLDNKPFSYATRTITTRQAEYAVDRKLIYVEPAPEHITNKTIRQEAPDVFQNTYLALLSLPRSETIREDLQNVADRNLVVQRAKNYREYAIERLFDFEDTRVALVKDKKLARWKSTKNWPDWDLNKSIKTYGYSYIGYHHTRVAFTTDEIAKLITRSFGYDEESSQFSAIRSIVQAWRNQHFKSNLDDKETARPKSKAGKEEIDGSENTFLYRMDIWYRIRRLKFMLQLIDRLFTLTEYNFRSPQTGSSAQKAKNILSYAKINIEKNHDFGGYHTALKNIRGTLNKALQNLESHAAKIKNLEIGQEATELGADDFKKILEFFKAKSSVTKNETRQVQPKSTSRSAVEQKNVLREELRKIRGAENIYNTMDVLYDSIHDSLFRSKELINQTLPEKPKARPSNNMEMIQKCLRFYLDHYDYFDIITLPILVGTGAQETDDIDIIRISPEDANSRINQSLDKQKKLLGVNLGNFGAFFKKEWRQNDILWGQLDTAEIVIKSLKEHVLSKVSDEIYARKFKAKGESYSKEKIGHITFENLDEIKYFSIDLQDDGQTREVIETVTNNTITRWVDEAQAGILREKFFHSREMMIEPLSSILQQVNATAQKKINSKLKDTKLDDKKLDTSLNNLDEQNIKSIIEHSLTNDQILDLFKNRKQPIFELPPQETLDAATRAIRVTGKVLENLSVKYPLLKSSAGWLLKLGQLSSSIIAVALPDTFLNVLGEHWTKLLYIAEGILILAGYIMARNDIVTIGWISAGVTLVLHLIILALKDVFLQGRKK